MEGPANSGDPTLMRPPQREFEFLRVRGCITLAACRHLFRVVFALLEVVRVCGGDGGGVGGNSGDCGDGER